MPLKIFSTWLLAILMAVTLTLGRDGQAAGQRIPSTDTITVYKFDLALLNGEYWVIQTGAWDDQARPLSLVRRYAGGTEERIALDPIGSGRAKRICLEEDIKEAGQAHGGQQDVQYALEYLDGDAWQQVAVDYPLLDTVYPLTASVHELYLADGALWYRSNYENAAAVSLERTFSNGQMEQTALPSDLKAQEAVRVLTAAQVEADLAPSSISSVTYRVVFQTNSEADYCS